MILEVHSAIVQYINKIEEFFKEIKPFEVI